MIFDLLHKIFDKRLIHIERPVSISSKDRYDFYVYAKPNNFAIDVFRTEGDIRHFINIFNIKENKYKKYLLESQELLYFVYFCDGVTKDRITEWLKNRKKQMPLNWRIISFKDIEEEVKQYKSYTVV